MSRKNRSPEEVERRAKIRELLEMSNVGSMADIQALFKEVIYAVMFMDAIHYHVRSEGQIVKKAVYIALGVNLEGRKKVLGMWVGEIESVFPKTEVQNCIIHQLRNSSKYVSYKDIKALMADLKAVYAAVDEPSAWDALEHFASN